MKSFKKISTRIFIGIFTGTLVVFSISSIVDYFYTRGVLQNIIQNYVERSFNASYSQLNSELVPLLNRAENTAFNIVKFDFANNDILRFQQKTMSKFKDIMSCSVVQYLIDEDTYEVQYVNSDTIITDYDTRLIQCNESKLSIKDTYTQLPPIDISLSTDTIRFFYYYYGIERNICVQYNLKLEKYIDIFKTGEDIMPSRHYLFDEANNVLENESTRYVNIPEKIRAEEIEIIRNLIEKEKKGLIIPKDSGHNRALYISKLRGTDIKIVSSIHVDKVINKFERYASFSNLITFFAMIILAYVLQRIIVKITRPIEELTNISKKIQEGSLNTIVPVYKGDGETAQLSDSLRSVQSKMKRYVSDLNSTMKVKRAMEHELKIANKIQADMIPDPDRALTELPEIDLYAKMIPAKGVAGDFYDYFFLNDKNLFFVIGDVSGKGIPAALFMVKTITLIKAAASKFMDPALVFKEVNEQLCLKNDEAMFVTAIGGILNIQSGELTICDAGHNAPIMGSKNSEFAYKDLVKGMPLGIMPAREYTNTNLKLHKNDTLLLYTDGFPECVGIKDTMLSEERLENSLKGKGALSLNIIANSLWTLIDNFRQETPASDDTTLLIIRHIGVKQ